MHLHHGRGSLGSVRTRTLLVFDGPKPVPHMARYGSRAVEACFRTALVSSDRKPSDARVLLWDSYNRGGLDLGATYSFRTPVDTSNLIV